MEKCIYYDYVSIFPGLIGCGSEISEWFPIVERLYATHKNFKHYSVTHVFLQWSLWFAINLTVQPWV